MNFSTPAKCHNLIKLLPYLRLGHSQNRAVEENVFASGQFRMETGAHFQQAGNRVPSPAPPRLVGAVTRRENFQQRAFARAVPANDAEDFTLLDLKGNSPQRPHFVVAQLC